jgi:hypothetical protein
MKHNEEWNYDSKQEQRRGELNCSFLNKAG